MPFMARDRQRRDTRQPFLQRRNNRRRVLVRQHPDDQMDAFIVTVKMTR